MNLSRRSLTIGGIGLAATSIVAVAVYEVPKLFKPRAKGQYADLVNLLDNPEQAAVVGRAIPVEAVPSDIKRRLAGTTLSTLIDEDSAQDRLVEAEGWVLPAALAELCALAAQSP